jgi:hypothetical protein
MEYTIVIKLENCIGNAKKVHSDMDDGRMDYSPYARIFDHNSVHWFKDAEYNKMFLMTQQQYANDKLKTKGYLFLNEVYEMLGFVKSKAGQVIGWAYDEENPIGDNYVDFDIFNDNNRDFINGISESVTLDFNVDGCILDRI